MPSYSRYRPMPTSGSSQRIEGLNAFGQPFRGRKIRGVGAEERAVGRAYGREQTSMKGGLWERGDGSQGNFAARKIAENEKAKVDYAERQRLESIERGRKRAEDAAKKNAPIANGTKPDAESLEAKRRVARKFMEYNRKKPVRPKTFVPMDRMA